MPATENASSTSREIFKSRWLNAILLSLMPVPGCAYPGMNAEMVGLIFQRLGINYTLFAYQGEWGSYNRTSNEFSGIMRDIHEGLFDADISDWRKTAVRIRQFHMPYFNWEMLPVCFTFAS